MDNSNKYPENCLGKKEKNIKTGREVTWQPLVDYRRNGVSENTIHGAVSWYSGSELIHSCGGDVLCYGRSMMKPFYIKVFADELAEATGHRPTLAGSGSSWFVPGKHPGRGRVAAKTTPAGWCPESLS